MADSERLRLSTRSLAALVAIFALVGFVLLAMLMAVIFLRPTFASDLPQILAELPSRVPAIAEVEPIAADEAAVLAYSDGQGWAVPDASPTPNPLRAKPAVAGGEVRPKWTATPLPTNTPVPSPTPNPTFVSSAYGLGGYMPDNIAPNERWIDVSLSEQKLVAYEGLIPVFQTLVSTGTARYPTVTGQFRIWLRFQAQDMDGYRLGYDYYLRNVPYVQYFYQDYALHGTFWHSNFGTPMSHGCVNLATPDAEWLYNWAGYGTLVNVHP